MTRQSGRQREALQRTREAGRAQEAARQDRVIRQEVEARNGEGAVHDPPPPSTFPPTEAGDHRRAATTCGWCGGPLEPKARGRIPKWCSPSCRQRAWEQSRAAASGLSAVQVVERRVAVRAPCSPTCPDWVRVLHDLGGQLDDGRVYDRDLPDLSVALNVVLEAYRRRPYGRHQASGLPD